MYYEFYYFKFWKKLSSKSFGFILFKKLSKENKIIFDVTLLNCIFIFFI